MAALTSAMRVRELLKAFPPKTPQEKSSDHGGFFKVSGGFVAFLMSKLKQDVHLASLQSVTCQKELHRVRSLPGPDSALHGHRCLPHPLQGAGGFHLRPGVAPTAPGTGLGPLSFPRSPSNWCPFSPLFWLGGFPYQSRPPRKRWYPCSNLSIYWRT